MWGKVMKYIKLTHGYETVVDDEDDEDYEEFKQ